MKWIVILSFAGLILGKFFFDTEKLKKKVRRNGGMQKLYQSLIDKLFNMMVGDMFLAEGLKDKVIMEYDLYVDVGSTLNLGFHYVVNQVHGKKVLIQYYNIYYKGGQKESLKWVFKEKEDPEFIVHKIEKDVNRFLEYLES